MLTLVNRREKEAAETHTDERPGGECVCMSVCVRQTETHRAEAGRPDAAPDPECALTDLSEQSIR